MKRRVSAPTPPASAAPRYDAATDAYFLADARAAAAGDADALARLVPALYQVAAGALAARLRGADPDDLADLTSEGVVKAVEQLHTARPVSAAMFRAWVRAVAWRAALDARRSRGRRDAGWGASALDPDGADASHAVLDPSALGDTSPEVGADGTLAALARLAVEAQRHLPPNAALVLWAHLVGGAGWAEVAVLVGTTPAGAKRRYQRALAALRAAVWRGAPDLPPPVRAAALARLRVLDPDRGPGASGRRPRERGNAPDAKPRLRRGAHRSG